MLTPERERGAEASTLLRMHGDDTRRFVAERIEALSLAGDRAGMERMTVTVERMDKLMRQYVVQ